MIRKILFIWQIRETIRVLCYGLVRASSAGEVYSLCLSQLPEAGAYYLKPWLEALWRGESEAVSREAERLWNHFKHSPVVRMLINLIFAIPHLWESRYVLCNLLTSLGDLSGVKWLWGNVPDDLIYMEGALISDTFTGAEQIQLLIYQCPGGRHGKCLRACMDKVIRAAGSNPMIQSDVLGEIVHRCKRFGEMNVILYAAMLMFDKEQEGASL
ncbi:MAG: hypothetical protein IKV74_07615 [Clostridia bacterium]|nr:hypothetical protein [Clostridia bacterium]